MSGTPPAGGPETWQDAPSRPPSRLGVERNRAPDQSALFGPYTEAPAHDGLGPGGECSDTPEENDYSAYLEFLKEHGHNFIRLWRWEHFRSQAAGGSFHMCMTPQPWPRSGPGVATDGKPRFDLATFDQDYFDRLRERVVAAGNAGIYVGVMFFDGWALHLSPLPHNVEGHPFTDTDHYAPGMGDVLWAWKSFLRGHNPILMDFGIIDVVYPLESSLGVPPYEAFEAARYAMGDTLRFAERMGLLEMQPRGDLSSTGYGLANPGNEYVVLAPSESDAPFSVDLEPGTYSVE